MSWVRPGVREVRAKLFWPTIALIALDFPELERPAKATSKPLSGTNWSGWWALVKKLAPPKLAEPFEREFITYFVTRPWGDIRV